MIIAPQTAEVFKRTTSLEFSRWYMGDLMTFLAEKEDTGGQFSLVEIIATPGTEPPPHVHTREDELYYVLEGEVDVYVEEKGFKVKAGESIFVPRLKPHAFVVRSPRLRFLVLITPGGLETYFRTMSSPAQTLELPTGAITYSTADVEQAARLIAGYGIQFITPDELADKLPLYPQILPI